MIADGAPHLRRATRAPSWPTIVDRYRDAGIDNILALGGDPPKDLDLPTGELHYAVELVQLVRERRRLLASGWPRTPSRTPARRTRESDRRHTAEKLAEADFAITQFFFDPAHYFELVESLRALGVDKPVIAGDHAGHEPRPASSAWPSCRARSSRRGSPTSSRRSGDDPAAVRAVGIAEATKLCAALLEGGAPGLHFYTLNRSTATREIYENLGLGERGVREG